MDAIGACPRVNPRPLCACMLAPFFPLFWDIITAISLSDPEATRGLPWDASDPIPQPLIFDEDHINGVVPNQPPYNALERLWFLRVDLSEGHADGLRRWRGIFIKYAKSNRLTRCDIGFLGAEIEGLAGLFTIRIEAGDAQRRNFQRR